MKKLLVTGGAGFIGSNFIRLALNETSWRIVALDALTYAGNLSNLVDVLENDHLSFVHGNICDQKILDSVFKEYEIDTVINFAAESHVDRSILSPAAFLETNVNGTYNLLEVARSYWADSFEKTRFLHVSTDEVFGSLAPDDPPFDEKSRYDPSSPYAASKAASDHLARAWHVTYRLPILISNCSNNYGPWQFPEKLIPLMILNAVESKSLPLYGDGAQVRDWLHVEDHCEALIKILLDGAIGETYCVGGGTELSNLAVVEIICDVVDHKLSRPQGTSRKLIRYVEDRPGHDRRYAIKSSKIKAQLDWQPKREFEKTISEVVDWYLCHSDWIDSICSGDYLRFYEEQYSKRLESAE